jgi:hypothetical protein
MVDPIITPMLVTAVMHFIAAHAVVVTVVALTAITLAGLAAWFQEREQVLDKNKNALAFTLSTMINNKQYVEIPGLFGTKAGSSRLIQGIYDKQQNKILDMRAITADRVDSQIAQAHAQESLAIYTRLCSRS